MGIRFCITLVVMSLAALLASGCAGDSAPAAVTPTALPATEDPNVIDFLGLREVAVGSSLADLTAAGAVAKDSTSCRGMRFTAVPYASPVFDGDKLVLIWANPPLHTPEGVTVGTSLDEARRVFPSAVELTPPPGSAQFPGLLISGGEDHAYLLLHHDGQVQKLIVGLERHARLLFDTGFGTC
jgi:hypothetical protein